jgi:radical SAM superfamily enzyme YgiQ (UPF0313 family)
MVGQTTVAVQGCGPKGQAGMPDARWAKKDWFLAPGFHRELERKLAGRPECEDVATGVFCGFDYRTRLGPFLYVDLELPPAGVLTVGASLVASGFKRTRVVLQQWSPNIRPSQSVIDGRKLEMVLVSGMQMHSAPMYELMADAHAVGADRPLILAGGPKAMHQPWDMFIPGAGADVVVTGEVSVFLQLADRLLDYRGRSGTMRQAFERARRDNSLLDLPGLVYRVDDGGPEIELVDTGKQLLLRDLDELPDPVLGYTVLEPWHKKPYMAARPMPTNEVRKHATLVPILTTQGCRFGCPYCPIPDNNHRSFRHKSPERLRWEIQHLAEHLGMTRFFGTDDNMFNNEQVVSDIFAEMCKGKVHGKPFSKTIFFGTEATLHDVYRSKDILSLCRKGGLRAIWFGIEDMTGDLVKKGQSAEKVAELFPLMRRWGVWPMPMLMHYEGQPFYTRGNLQGIANQVSYLEKCGAGSVQITFLTPAVGTKMYDKPFNDGCVARRIGKLEIEDRFYDGQHVVACDPKVAFRHQMNLLGAYVAFYNPINFVKKAVRFRNPMNLYDTLLQYFGMAGWVRSVWRMREWLWNLWLRPITPYDSPPRSPWKIWTAEEYTARLAAPQAYLGATA